MILTLTELVSVSLPYYLFVFTHVTTKGIIKFVKSEADDESDYPQRYNQFTIDASSVFLDQPTGEWHYIIYQQNDPDNLDPTSTNGILEEGKLLLDRATEFEYTQYNSTTTYKAYNG